MYPPSMMIGLYLKSSRFSCRCISGVANVVVAAAAVADAASQSQQLFGIVAFFNKL